jgi:gas vesicle protein
VREDREVMVVESDGMSGFKWFVVGAAIGAGVALLFAPQSGERTRRDLTRRGKKLKHRAQETLEEFADEVQTRGRDLKESVEEFADDVMDEVKEKRRTVERSADRAVSSARDEMERRLTEARSRARAAAGVDDEDDDESD